MGSIVFVLVSKPFRSFSSNFERTPQKVSMHFANPSSHREHEGGARRSFGMSLSRQIAEAQTQKVAETAAEVSILNRIAMVMSTRNSQRQDSLVTNRLEAAESFYRLSVSRDSSEISSSDGNTHAGV